MAYTLYEYNVRIRTQYGNAIEVRVTATDNYNARLIAEAQYGKENVISIGNVL